MERINYNSLKFIEFLDKINPQNSGIIFSISLHLLILLFAVGLPNFFGPKEPSRSIPLKNFEKIFKLDFNFYYFQNEIWDRDREFLKKIKITDYSKEKFSDIIFICPSPTVVSKTVKQ